MPYDAFYGNGGDADSGFFRMKSLIKIFSVVLLAATLAVGNAAFASSVFEAGQSLRVFHPTHADSCGIAIAPAVGDAFCDDGFREVKVPVAMVVGQGDTIAPADTNASKFHRQMPASQLKKLPGGVGHYTFLHTCGAAGKTTLPVYCTDAAGIDRDQVHAKVSGMSVEFFDKNLR